VAALSALPLSQDGFGPTVEDVRKGLIGKIGENMSIRRFKRYAGWRQAGHYLHGTRIGVVVEFDGRRRGRQGRGDARRGDEAQGAGHQRRAGRADRGRAQVAAEKAAEDSGKPQPRSSPRWSKARCRSS
jgi:elongation factor Ts